MRPIYLIIAIFLAALNLRPIITSVAPLLGTMQTELGMAGLTASLLTTLPVLCMGIFTPVATSLRDRIGLERTIFAALAIITAATAIRALPDNVFLLITTAVLGGIGISIVGPLLSGFIKKYFPHHPGVVSVYSVSLTIGASLASGFAVPIYNRSSQHLELTLSIWAVLGVIAMLVWGALLRPKGEAQYSGVRSRLPLRNKRAIRLTLIFGLMASIFYSMTAWISPIALSLGYNKSEAALLLTIFTFVQIPVSLVLPGIVAKFGRRRMFLVLCSLFELVGILLILFKLPMLPAAIFVGIGAGGLFPLALMLPIVETDNAQDAGAWSAMSQCGGYIIGAMGPLAIGAMYDATASFTPALFTMIVIILGMITVQLGLSNAPRTAANNAAK